MCFSQKVETRSPDRSGAIRVLSDPFTVEKDGRSEPRSTNGQDESRLVFFFFLSSLLFFKGGELVFERSLLFGLGDRPGGD